MKTHVQTYFMCAVVVGAAFAFAAAGNAVAAENSDCEVKCGAEKSVENVARAGCCPFLSKQRQAASAACGAGVAANPADDPVKCDDEKKAACGDDVAVDAERAADDSEERTVVSGSGEESTVFSWPFRSS